MNFSDIPDRINVTRIIREWFDNLRDAGVSLEELLTSFLGAGFIQGDAPLGNTQTNADIADLVFDKTKARCYIGEALAYRKSSTVVQLELISFVALCPPDTDLWEIYELAGNGAGLDAGVSLAVDDATGQAKYSSDTVGGTYDTEASKWYFTARALGAF